jgi:heavy metal sensor kinase
VTPLPLRTHLTVVYTGMLALLVAGLAFATRAAFVRQLDTDATASLEDRARALHGYLQFRNGAPVLAYDRDDPDAAAFIDEATDYYQVYDARDGRLLTQSPGLTSLGLHYTPVEIADFRAQPGCRDVQTDRGRFRLISTVISPSPGEASVVQVGESLDRVDRTVTALDRLLLWSIMAGLVLATIAGRWLAGRALAPLTRLADAAQSISVVRLHDRLAVRGANDELDQVARAFNDALARVERSVGEMRQFSGALAHELRTPLAILRSEAELALRQPSSDDALRQTLARQIDEFDRLTRLIGQILTLARAEAGEIPMAEQTVDLGALGASVTEQIEPVASAQGVALTCDAADGVSVTGDAGWLQRLLLILLDNALKHTPEGGRISVRCARANGFAEVAVTDTGSGIAPDVLPRVFERFYRGDPVRSGESRGAGLGLTLAKWIAERHRGTIDVTSRPGEGATFTVRLPARPDRRAPPPVNPG